MRALCIVLSLLPWGAFAAEGVRDGTYDAYDCTVPISDQRVTISGDRIRFYESACTLRDPVVVRDMEGARLFNAQCAGEGMEWQARYLLMQANDGGLIVVGSRWAERHQRCD